jgi:hypothetical protein
LADEARYRRWSAFATREERIVAYADKRCGQRLEPMAERFAAWRRRFPAAEDAPNVAKDRPARYVIWDRAAIERVWQRALRLEADVCRAAGVRPEEVRRLAWTSAAFRRAGR